MTDYSHWRGPFETDTILPCATPKLVLGVSVPPVRSLHPKINTTLMVNTNPSPLVDETIAFYTYAYRNGCPGRSSGTNSSPTPRVLPAREDGRETSKNNQSKPFPCNFNAAMPVQRKIAVFRPQISRRMPSIRILSNPESVIAAAAISYYHHPSPSGRGAGGEGQKHGGNIKNNHSKPFPCNRKPSMPFQRKIADFRTQISRRMPSICTARPGIPSRPQFDQTRRSSKSSYHWNARQRGRGAATGSTARKQPKA